MLSNNFYLCVIIFYYYRYSALGPVWAETRIQSGDWYGSGTLHPGQVLFFLLLALQPPMGVVFYSPLVGFSLLAYEVS